MERGPWPGGQGPNMQPPEPLMQAGTSECFTGLTRWAFEKKRAAWYHKGQAKNGV